MLNTEWELPNDKQTADRNEQPMYLKIPAHLFSVIFHPLFIPLYVIGFLIYFHPSYFSGFGIYEKNKILFITALNTVFFPALSVLLMKGLGFIQSVMLHKQQDRIGPYLAAMIFYFWAAWVFFKFEPQLSPVLPSFMTGIVITTVVALIANIYFKISMHAMAAGGMLGIFIVIMHTNSMLMTWPLCLALLIAGIVCSSRLLVSDHQPADIYRGLLAGFLCQLAAAITLL